MATPEVTQQSDSSEVDASPEVDDPIVKLDNVTKRYGSVVAVDNVSLDVRQEEFLTLLGPSGTGKTTLLHIIAGFVEPTEGGVYMQNQDVSGQPPYEREFGLVFQDLALFPHMSVRDNIAFPLKMQRTDPSKTDEKIDEVLDLVRLPLSYKDSAINELSGGQQQRVAIARAIVYEPPLLLLDEPLSSLDKKLREEMQRELLRIHQETDLTIIHVTHNQTEALRMSDRIAVMQNGGIEQLASKEELYSSPATPFVADFVGNTTLLSGQLIHNNDEGGSVRAGETKIEFAGPIEAEPGASVTTGVRAERIQIGLDLETTNRQPATVEQVVFEGAQTLYTVESAGHTFEVLSQNTENTELYRLNQTVEIGWEPTDTMIWNQSYPVASG